MSPLGLVIAIVLVDLLGFSIVMPLLAPFGREYGFSPAQVGGLLAAYPLAQLVAAPILGRLSDRYGRRPVLAASQFGTALSFLILGLSGHYPTMLVARLLDGASGGNILVAQAYVADITPPERRSRSYGLIGMAFGLGFFLGPLLGVALIGLPGVAPEWRLRLPFLVAAGFSTLAWVLVILRLPESLPADVRARQAARVVSRRGLADVLALPGAGGLVALGSLATLAFAALEATLSLYLDRRQGWGPEAWLGGFTFLGLVTAVVQGGLVRRLVTRLGEPRLIVAGVTLLALGFLALAWGGSDALVVLALAAVGTGYGLASPTISGLLSRVVPAAEQGAIFGVYTAAQTLARLLNYLASSLLFGHASAGAPFWEAAALALAGLALAALILPRAARLVAGGPPGGVEARPEIPSPSAESLAPGPASSVARA